jgi:hypothetical protein
VHILKLSFEYLNVKSTRSTAHLEPRTLRRVIPWIIFAVIVVPLVVVAFLATRRSTAASERLAGGDADAGVEQQFAEAEAYEAKWHEEDKEKFHQERLP